eukprot:Hpha_TRINITY_DN1420_c0_g1::TRINITY_DN1420_c0_g1_i1::g.9604::m.9604/K11254/H4; histone H4
MAKMSKQADMGKGKGKGRGRPPKEKKAVAAPVATVSNGAFRRLARQAGVRRVARASYAVMQREVRNFVKEVMEDVLAVLSVTQKKTIKTQDVLFALKSQGNLHYTTSD